MESVSLVNNKYFPYSEFKDGQDKILESIFNGNNPIIVEAGTGSGKTIASLCGLLEKRKKDEKIIVFVRTINQMNPIIKEWAAIKNHTKEQLTILPLLGKSRLSSIVHVISKNTIIRSNKEIYGYKKKKLLKKLKSKNHRHRLLKMISWELVKEPTVENYKNILGTKENCPYYNIWSVLEDADIIVATYGYLKQLDRIIKESGAPLDKMHIIIDEAHNFARERYYSIKKHHLLLFMNLFYKDDFLERIYDEIRGLRILTWEDILGTSEDPHSQIKKVLGKIEVSLRMVRENSVLLQQLPPKMLEGDALVNLFKNIRDVLSNYKSGTIIVSKDSFNIVDINPERYFNTLVNASSLILQSGTICPPRIFRKLYSLPEETTILELIERDIRIIRRDPNIFKSCYVSSLTSTSRFRNKELYERYAKVITEIFTRSPSHILVLGPSYDFIHNLARFLKQRMIVETRASKTDELHKGIINSPEKTIILGNQNGKIMEGNEWTIDGRSVVNTVVLTGLAMRVPREADEIIFRHRSRILQDEYLAKLFANQIPLSIIADQSFGRTRRNPEDKGALIILDDRVDEFLQRRLWLSRYSILNDLLSDYEKFFGSNVC